MRTYEQRLDEAREELARATDGETSARLSARVKILERRIEEAFGMSVGVGPVPSLGVKFNPLKHPRARAGKFRATGHYDSPNPHMASIGQETAAFRRNVGGHRELPTHARHPHGRTDPYTGPNPHMASVGQDDDDRTPELVKRIRKITGYNRNTKLLKRFGHALVDDKNSMFPSMKKK